MLNNIDSIPELHFKLLEVDYTDNQLLDFIRKYDIQDVKDFNIIDFKFFLPSAFNKISTHKPNTPITGELYFDQNDCKVRTFNGSIWIEIA